MALGSVLVTAGVLANVGLASAQGQKDPITLGQDVYSIPYNVAIQPIPSPIRDTGFQVAERVVAPGIFRIRYTCRGPEPARELAERSQWEQTATLAGTSSREALQGTPGPDVIAALGANDVVFGAGSDDAICGDNGDDRLDGAGGDDWLMGGLGNDNILGAEGDDRIDGGEESDGEYLGASGDLHIRPDPAFFPRGLRGGPSDDVITGGPGADVLIGGLGNDVLIGGGGKDWLFGEAGDDVLVGGTDSLDVDGESGENEDELRGGFGDDVCSSSTASRRRTDPHRGLRGRRRAGRGGRGSDRIIGSEADDDIEADDRLMPMGAGDDTVEPRGGRDRVYAGGGNDILRGSAGPDDFLGGTGTDSLTTAAPASP